MAHEDTEAASHETSPDRSEEVAVGGGREDNRNEELDQSPIPDPEAKDTGTGDDPQAD